MITLVLVALLGLSLGALVALPLVAPGHADPLPDDRDPLLQDLEEERDALFAAIRELDGRHDLDDARRSELRARYEAKAARVLRALDERRGELAGRSLPRSRPVVRRTPWGLVGLLVIGTGTAATLGGFVLPRVGQNATVTSFFEDDLAAAERIRDLRRAAENDPTPAGYAVLGDAYWSLEDAEGAGEAYQEAIEAGDDAPARAYARLGLLALSSDLTRAQELLEEARARDDSDPATLGTLAELYLAAGDYGAAEDALEDLLATPEAAGDVTVGERLALVRDLAPLAAAAEADANPATLLPLAEALWQGGDRERAAESYFRVLTEFDAEHPTALARVGELLFLSGRNDDALALLDRARSAAATRDEPLPENALLFLGNAAFSAEEWALAVDAWRDHLEVTDEPGRVPSLIEQAQARARGEEPPAGETSLPLPGAAAGEDDGAAATPVGAAAADAGAELFAQNCATCHGAQGAGGSGPRLAGNPSVGRARHVASIIRDGRGMMPGFRAQLSDEEIDTLTGWLVEAFAP